MAQPAQLAHIGIGEETTWGAGVAPTIFVPATKDVNIEVARLRLEGPFATVAQVPSVRGRTNISGGMSGVPAYTDAFGLILKAALGAPTTSGTGPYTHQFDVASAPVASDHARPPMSVQWSADGVTRRYTGGQISQLTLQQSANDFLKANLDWVFKYYQDGIAAATPTFPSDAVFGFRDLQVTKGGTPLGIAVEELTITINNNMEGVQAVGSDQLAAVVIGTVTAEAQMTLEFNDAAVYNDYVAGNTDSYGFTWTNGTNVLDIQFARAAVTAHSQPIPASGRLTAAVTVAAELDTTAGGYVTVSLTNSTATY